MVLNLSPATPCSASPSVMRNWGENRKNKLNKINIFPFPGYSHQNNQLQSQQLVPGLQGTCEERAMQGGLSGEDKFAS